MSVETTNLLFVLSKMTTPGPGPVIENHRNPIKNSHFARRPGNIVILLKRNGFYQNINPGCLFQLIPGPGDYEVTARPGVDILRISGDNNPSGPVPVEKSTKIIEICKNTLTSGVSRAF